MTGAPFVIIGLTGLAGAGKDCVRGILEREQQFHGMAFADTLRAMAGAFLSCAGADPHRLTDRALKEQPIPGLPGNITPRQIMQTIGTEWGRSLHPDLWLSVARCHVGYMRDAGVSRFVVSDVRFPNEAEWVRSLGGFIWRVDRPGLQPVRSHASEAHAMTIKADRVINNSGTLQDLQHAVNASA